VDRAIFWQLAVRYSDRIHYLEFTMQREIGDPRFPLWLLGDSNPLQWQAVLQAPLDPRHPIRHNIWTAVLDEIQERVYQVGQLRLETARLYIRNAVEDSRWKPTSNQSGWGDDVNQEITAFGDMLHTYRPLLVFSFGAFAYEFARRATGTESNRASGYWGARRLGQEFRRRMTEFDPAGVNVAPLLHRSISGGKFIQSHEYFCDRIGANYFAVVGKRVATTLLEHCRDAPVWLSPLSRMQVEK
jgi:hypothetical protein